MLTKQRKLPLRTCVSCRQTADKRTLLRFVRSASGQVSLDVTGRMPGRGAYVHEGEECFAAARKSGSLARALKVSLAPDDYARLALELDSCEVRGMVTDG